MDCAYPPCEIEVFNTKHCSDQCKRMHRSFKIRMLVDPKNECLYCGKVLKGKATKYCSGGLHSRLYINNQRTKENIQLGIGEEPISPFVPHKRREIKPGKTIIC